MKSLIACLMSALIFSITARADTTWVAEGNISGVWNADGSPYVVQGNLTLPTGSFLFIEPGVQVYFENSYWIHADSGAIFQAIGTETDSIFFTTDTLLNPNRWNGIEIRKAADTIRVDYCVFEYGKTTSVNAAMECNHTPLLLSHSAFRDNTKSVPTGDGGCGLNVSDSYSEIKYCIFERNSLSYGPAASFPSSNISIAGTIENCVFSENSGTSGGAIFGGFIFAMTVRECLFVSNECIGEMSWRGGGAMWIEGNNGVFENCQFLNNYGGMRGGAIYDMMGGDAQFHNCLFYGNHADSTGGAIYHPGDNSEIPELANCTFQDNSAYSGGALHIGRSKIRNCTFVSNSAIFRGAAVFLSNATYAEVVNCSIVNSTDGQAVANMPNYYWSFQNNLMFGNTDGNFWPLNPPNYIGDLSGINLNRDSCDNFLNLFQDPQFENPEAGNYTPAQGSPLINAGLFGGTHGSPLDPDSTLPDIGAIYRHRAPDVTGVPDETSDAPEPNPLNFEFTLEQNYPNPFNAETSISYQLPKDGAVELAVYDITGRLAVNLVNETQSAGQHNVKISSADLATGVYIYRLSAGEFQQSRKLVVLK